MTEKSEFEIRLLQEGEADALVRFLSDPLIDQSFVPPLSERTITIDERVTSKMQTGFWMVALNAGVIVGCRGCNGVVDTEKRLVEFSTLAVDPSCRGYGLGAKLLEEAFHLALRRYNPAEMKFDSWVGNIAVERGAIRLGFKKSEPYANPKRPQGVMSVAYTWIA